MSSRLSVSPDRFGQSLSGMLTELYHLDKRSERKKKLKKGHLGDSVG